MGERGTFLSLRAHSNQTDGRQECLPHQQTRMSAPPADKNVCPTSRQECLPHQQTRMSAPPADKNVCPTSTKLSHSNGAQHPSTGCIAARLPRQTAFLYSSA